MGIWAGRWESGSARGRGRFDIARIAIPVDIVAWDVWESQNYKTSGKNLGFMLLLRC